MRTGLFVVAALVFTAALPAQAGDEPLSTFLSRCSGDDSTCITELESGYDAALSMGEVCPPNTLSEESAARSVLAWLRNAAAYNSAIAGGSEDDAEWTALHTLWPCSQ